MTPAGTSNELDVQNEWEENTHTHTQEYNGGLLPGIILILYHEEFLFLYPMFPPKPFDNFPPEDGCSEGLDAFRCVFKNSTILPPMIVASEGKANL